MLTVRTIADLQRVLKVHARVTLVPTMGNLHAGHLSLVRIARERGDPVVTSIFVNPLQFAPHEDLGSYPRTLDRDCALLAESGCHVVFAPTDAEMYPEAHPFSVRPPPQLSDILEGASRLGFFNGVCTIVLKLFNLVRPAAAVFGKKDYQQLLVLRRMQQDLNLPIEILAGDIVRDPRGLALSSRNAYLSEYQLTHATHLHTVLNKVAAAIRGGQRDWHRLEYDAVASLAAQGWRPDYVAIRRQADLGEPTPSKPLLVLGAGSLGRARLIDNVEI